MSQAVSRVPLTVVVLAKNEAARIRECLESVRWADDVLVIDDDSTDGTAQLAGSLGARVMRRTMDNEGRHRNWAATQAKHDWILSLDADERATPELAVEIAGLLGNGGPPHQTYAIPRRNHIGTQWLRHGGWYPSAQLKLFNRSVFRWEETTVHPRAIANCSCGTLTADLIHFSYRNLTDFVAKLNRQTTLEAQKWLQDGRRMTMGKAFWRTIDRAWRSYVGKQGRRDGWVGLFTAICGGMYQWLAFAKYWERHLPGRQAPAESDRSGSAQAPRPPAQRRERLTALLMTKNEERRIAGCLASLAWADEVIVVDGQSTDRTADICRAAGARVISRAFSGSFAEERNAGLDLATGDWIMQLDADERVTPELRAAIARMLSERNQRYQAYQVWRKNIFLGRFMRYGGWYHRHLCLFRRGRRYHGLVHEQIDVTGLVGQLEGDLQHEPFDSLEQFVDRHNRYTSLQAQELFARHGHLPWARAWRTLWQRPLKHWWKFYVKKQGFREGMHGMVFCLLFAWVDFIAWAKYCELAYGVGLAEPKTGAVNRAA